MLTDPWSNKASASLFSLDPNSSKLRPALLGSQAEQNGPPRLTSLPSISSLTLQESHDSEHYQHLYYHTSNTFARNHLLTRHSSQGSTVSPVKHNLTLPPVHVPGSTGSHILPTGPRSPDRQSLNVTLPQTFEGTLDRVLWSSRMSPSDAPSPPPPSPATTSTQTHSSGDLNSSLVNLPSTSLQKKIQKNKDPNPDNIEQLSSSRTESDRKRYMCPFEGCGRQYTLKENLIRHRTT